MIVDYFILRTTFMFRHVHARHWATLLTKSGPSCRTEVESSERHEVLFTRIIPSDVNAPFVNRVAQLVY